MSAPDLIAIDHDHYHAEHVGRTADGTQFFLTTPFEPATNGQGNEFVALFLFDRLARSRSQDREFGPRAEMDRDRRRNRYEARLRELGDVTFTRIEVAPFRVERFGTTFGLIARPGEDENAAWWVEVHPGNYMAFTEPWDSGEYDT